MNTDSTSSGADLNTNQNATQQAMQQLSNYLPSLNNIASYSQQLKSLAVDVVKGRNAHLLNNNGIAMHTVTFMKFDSFTFNSITNEFLIISSSTGWQVFLIQQSSSIPATNENTAKLQTKKASKAIPCANGLNIIKVGPKRGKQIPGPISCASFLKYTPTHIRKHRNFEGPIIAVAPSTDKNNGNFDSKCVRLYSLMEQQYILVHRHRTKVHGILTANERLICITEREIIVRHPSKGDIYIQKFCAPSPMNSFCAALGDRWLAYADTKVQHSLLPSHMKSSDVQSMEDMIDIEVVLNENELNSRPMPKISKDMNDRTSSAVKQISNVASDLSGSIAMMVPDTIGGYASTISDSFYSLSERGKQKMSQYLETSKKQIKKQVKPLKKQIKSTITGSQPTSSSFSSSLSIMNPSIMFCAEPPKHGIVSVIDIDLKGECFLSFIAHEHTPLMHMQFDPSGTLLVTADRDGQFLNIFQIIGFPTASTIATHHGSGNEQNVQRAYRHIYRIYRGLTYANIRNISFSCDSRWMTVASARGTVHLYGINREGGQTNYLTHNSIEYEPLSPRLHSPLDINKTIELSSVMKLHHSMDENIPDLISNGTKICVSFLFAQQNPYGCQTIIVQTPIAFEQYTCVTQNIVSANDMQMIDNQQILHANVNNVFSLSTRDMYCAPSLSYPYLHSQLYPPLMKCREEQHMSALQLDGDEDTQRWLSNFELHSLNRTHNISIWNNPQFKFYSFKSESNVEDPYAFLDFNVEENAVRIHLNDENSPLMSGLGLKVFGIAANLQESLANASMQPLFDNPSSDNTLTSPSTTNDGSSEIIAIKSESEDNFHGTHFNIKDVEQTDIDVEWELC